MLNTTTNIMIQGARGDSSLENNKSSSLCKYMSSCQRYGLANECFENGKGCRLYAVGGTAEKVRAVAEVPESRQYFLNMKSQGFPCCPQCYDGCAKALEVGRINNVCSQDFNNCPLYRDGLNSEDLIGGRN